MQKRDVVQPIDGSRHAVDGPSQSHALDKQVTPHSVESDGGA